MTNETLIKKIAEIKELSATAEKISDEMAKLKGEVLAELDERKVDKFEVPSQKLCAAIVNKVTNTLDKKKLAVHFKGEIPAEFWNPPTTSHYVQIKEL